MPTDAAIWALPKWLKTTRTNRKSLSLPHYNELTFYINEIYTDSCVDNHNININRIKLRLARKTGNKCWEADTYTATK